MSVMNSLMEQMICISCSDGISIEGRLMGSEMIGTVLRWVIEDPYQIAGLNANHGQWKSGPVTNVEAIKMKSPLLVADHLIVRMGPTFLPNYRD